MRMKLGLTLSAYRRPEDSIKLTDVPSSSKITDKYDWPEGSECILGQGASSVVRLAFRREDDLPVAVKCMLKSDLLRLMKCSPNHQLLEYKILREVSRHDQIVSLLDVYETDMEVYLVLDYCAGGELFQKVVNHHKKKLKLYKEKDASIMIQQVLEALLHLHSKGIVHRDVKLENILVVHAENSTKVKLTDFGSARWLLSESQSTNDVCSLASSSVSNSPLPGDFDFKIDGNLTPPTSTSHIPLSSSHSRQRAYSRVGSDYYVAPEVVNGSIDGYSLSVDMFSLGVCTYILLSGQLPPVVDEEDFSKEVDDSLLFKSAVWKDVSENAKIFIRDLLWKEPTKRLTAALALNHTWIKGDKKTVKFEPSQQCLQLPRKSSKRKLYEEIDDSISETGSDSKFITDKLRSLSVDYYKISSSERSIGSDYAVSYDDDGSYYVPLKHDETDSLRSCKVRRNNISRDTCKRMSG